MQLSKAQNNQLKGLAHQLKPVVMIGQNGLSEAVIKEIELALDQHELIKIKMAADREERAKIIVNILKINQIQLIQKIGQMGVFFRRNQQKPLITLK